MEKKEKAVQIKHMGYNCCQAVLAAFAEELGITDEQARRLGAAFGAGMGGMEGTCGALCGAELVLGIKEYSGKPILAQARSIHNAFQKKCGATICKDLKGVETGTMLCSCDDCVRSAAEIVEQALF
ncbi:MAG TPA: hypothetical protein DDX51_03955 [Clostridiales bacterium]|nr:hypothetical protein [Clostridiales bacterium]